MMVLKNIQVCVVGLGYVGLPLARLFSTRYHTVGFDCNTSRIDALKAGHDSTGELSDEQVHETLNNGLCLISELSQLNKTSLHTVFIIAVPTPVDCDNRPDLKPLLEASRMVGAVLGKGDYVVYESTVYPGVTEEECVPMLVDASGLRYNEDFFVGYSPERINPGDKEHTVETICKVTSGSTAEAAEIIDALYCSVLKNGTHRAPSIRVAEASKIVENCQRDVNIAFMNELAKIFGAMNIDTGDVLDAAASKWNFIRMKPGLVGGHCIGVDPYYLIEKAQVYGVLPRVMYNARRLNDGMGDYVAQQLVKQMNLKGLRVKDARILILGFSFKENCPDTRNTKVADIYHTLVQYTDRITVCDPNVDIERVYDEYGIKVVARLKDDDVFDAAVLSVAHVAFADLDIRKYVPEPGVVYDVKGFLPREVVTARL
ncbi:MAG: nucleotide sugar dehydrogenase [Bacteroidales bacterium]|nr:nucleotide sugar dehydrogenase [Bacteroidales bacterium]